MTTKSPIDESFKNLASYIAQQILSRLTEGSQNIRWTARPKVDKWDMMVTVTAATQVNGQVFEAKRSTRDIEIDGLMLRGMTPEAAVEQVIEQESRTLLVCCLRRLQALAFDVEIETKPVSIKELFYEPNNE